MQLRCHNVSPMKVSQILCGVCESVPGALLPRSRSCLSVLNAMPLFPHSIPLPPLPLLRSSLPPPSGPRAVSCIASVSSQLGNASVVATAVVPDDIAAIQAVVRRWTDGEPGEDRSFCCPHTC